MIDLPTTELLQLWADLVEASHGVNGYGGHIAEIYFYRLARYDPSALKAQEDASFRETTSGREAHRDWVKDAYDNLFDVLALFADKYDACARVDGVLVAAGRTKPRVSRILIDNTHRWHVKVWSASDCEPEGR